MTRLPADFEWRRSPQHISFLSYFRKPYPRRLSGTGEYILKESIGPAIDRFLRDEVLVSCDLREKVAYKLKVTELKAVLLRHGKKPSGGKAELVDAALATARDEMEGETRELVLYKCTPSGIDAINEFERNKAEAEIRFQTESHEHLLSGNAKAAYSTCVAWWQGYIDPQFTAHSPAVERLQFILGSQPKAIGHLEQNDWQILRAAAGMKTLYADQSELAWLPEGFRTPIGDSGRAVRLLLCQAEFRQSFDLRSPYYKKVRLTFDGNDVEVCEHCAVLDGSEHEKNELPEIPTEHCTSRNGCACRVDGVWAPDDRDAFSHELASGDETDEISDETEDGPVLKLRQLKRMLDESLIEQPEYDEKKKEILDRM